MNQFKFTKEEIAGEKKIRKTPSIFKRMYYFVMNSFYIITIVAYVLAAVHVAENWSNVKAIFSANPVEVHVQVDAQTK